MYEYKPAKQEAHLAAVSLVSDNVFYPQVIDCSADNFWQLHKSLTEDCLVVPLGQNASRLTIPEWPTPLREATVLPIRLSERGEPAGFLVLGIHPGRAFDENYRDFVRRIAEQIAIGLAASRAYEEERQRAEALAEIDRAKTAFFSNVSHEFRTPLALMLGPLEEVLSEAGDRLSPERHEQLIMVRRNAARLLKLVNTLLDFSRLEAGRVQAVFEATDLAVFTAEIASVFRSAIEKAGLRFSVDCKPVADEIYVDRDMWEKVVSNLLSNAFKFTFEGLVSVSLQSVGNAVELVVRDTGVGIPEDQLARVFERFHRIEGTHARTHEGTGIGLALVNELIRIHGGSVHVESVLSQGSVFTVTVPQGSAHLSVERIHATRSLQSTAIGAEAYADEARRWLPDEANIAGDVAVLSERTLLSTAPRAEPAMSRELIVVADDNADMRQYLGHLLGDRYDVQAVADGQRALEVTRLLRPGLVLADVMMPQLDGFGLLRAIRDDPQLSSTPVILVSARAGEESRVEGLHAGADDYLVKPFTSRELLARVEAHLKLVFLRREAAEREMRLRSEAELEHQKLRASEDRLAETNRHFRELQNREAKIRRLVDANIIGVVTWDLEGRILDANDAYLRMVGYERGDLLSGNMRWMDLTPPEWLEREERTWIPQLKVAGSLAPFEKEYFRKDGGRVPVLLGLALIEENGNEGIAFALDLTERKRAADALRDLQAELAHANRLATMGQLTASIAHEVNQPIGAARNNAHAALRFLGRTPPDLTEVNEALECVISETYRAGDIVSRIRDQVKKVPPSMRSVDLNDAIEEVVGLVRGELARNGVSPDKPLRNGLPLAHGDRGQLQQDILNLMLNAIEAMTSIECEPRELVVRTELHSPDNLLATIADSGPGIPPGLRERIFESFYTTKAGGVGIGLSICRSIMDAHGGRLWAEDQQPRGALLKFTLPTQG
jgi:PAS domain S-box-containing protein